MSEDDNFSRRLRGNDNSTGIRIETESLNIEPTMVPNSNYSGNNNRDKLEVAGEFKYHFRVGMAFLMSIPPLLSYTNRLSYFILTLGFVVSYVLDFLHLSRKSFISFLVCIGLFLGTLYYEAVKMFFTFNINFIDVMILFVCLFYSLLFSLYGSLQFKFFQKKMGLTKIYLEKFLFAMLPFVTIPLIMTSLTEMNGLSNAPFYLAFLIALEFHFFCGKIKPSFRVRNSGSIRKGKSLITNSVQYPFVSMIMVFFILFVPSFSYFGIHIHTFSINFHDLFNVLGLFSFGVFVLMSNPNHYLWFIRDKFYFCSFIFKIRFIQPCVLAISSFVLFMFFEYKVIFNRYPHLLLLQFPYNFILFNFAIFLVLLMFLFVLNTKLDFYSSIMDDIQKSKGVFSEEDEEDEEKEDVDLYNTIKYRGRRRGPVSYKTLFFVSLLCFVATSSIFLVLGIEMWAFPFFALSLAGITNFLMTFNWMHYCVFVLFSGVSLVGWLFKNFGFLDLEMDFKFLPFLPWTVNLQHVMLLIGIEYVLSLLLIPLIKMKSWNQVPYFVRFLFWAVHVILLSFLEEILYEQGDNLYSPLLLITTTVLYIFILHFINKKKLNDTNFFVSPSSKDIKKRKRRGVEYFGFNSFNFLLACALTKLVLLVDSPAQHVGKFLSCFPFVFLLCRICLLSYYRARVSQLVSLLITLSFIFSIFLCKDVLWGPLLDSHSSMHVISHTWQFYRQQAIRKLEYEGITTQLEMVKFQFTNNTGFDVLRYFLSLILNLDAKLFGMMVFIMGLGLLPLSHGTLIHSGFFYSKKKTEEEEEEERISSVYSNLLFRRFSLLLLLMGFVWGSFEPLIRYTSSSSGSRNDDEDDLILLPYFFLFSVLSFFGFVLKVFKLPKNNVMKIFVFSFISITFGITTEQMFFADDSYHVMFLLPFTFWIVGLILCFAHFGRKNKGVDLGLKLPTTKDASFSEKLCFVLYLFFLFLMMVLYQTCTVFSGHKADESEKITMFALGFILNLFIGILLRFKIQGKPLITDTSVSTRHRKKKDGFFEKDEIIKTPMAKELLLGYIVNISSFLSYGMGLLLVNWVFEDRQAYLFVTLLLILLPKESYERMNKYLIIAALLQIKCFIMFLLDLISVYLRNWRIKDEEFLQLLSKSTLHVALFMFLFPTHLYVDALFLNYMKKRPNLFLSIFMLCLCSFVFYVEQIDSIKLSALVGIIESVVLALISVQWRKKKFISKDNQLIQ